MGYTNFTVELIERHLQGVKTVIDLGAQNMYNTPTTPAPYASEWYKGKGIVYAAVDLSGENKSLAMDLSVPCQIRNSDKHEKSPESAYLNLVFDMVVDAGTSEHVGRGGKFDWTAIYNCWRNKFDWCKVGGKIISENPKSGNWPGHGFNYVTDDFYRGLREYSDLEILEIGEQAAMGNVTDGWNVYCVMEKTGDKFPTLEQFKKLDVKQK